MRTETGDMIIDWYMELATDETMPFEARNRARDVLRAFAWRGRRQTVQDVLGKPN